ncbi:MAG TPA: hypothetical protein DCZ40_12650 [Lachnospiraceae bacterium]|nr:hypothetical protein [Lachnospiraceae bacterium]
MIGFFSDQNPERKRKLAAIYSIRGNFDEAYKALEEVLFSEYQIMSGALLGIYMIAMKTEDYEKAQDILERASKLCDLFDMGAYNKISTKLDYYVSVKDASQVLQMMDDLLEHTNSLLDFTKSKLFVHINFKKLDMSFMDKILDNLLKQFQNDESYEFIRKHPECANFVKKWYS